MGKRHKSKTKAAGAISRDQGPEAAHTRRGNALLEEGKLDQAAACYSQALKSNPDSHETINSLGVLLLTAGRVEQAAVCYQKAISLKEDYAASHSDLGIALKYLGRLDEALASVTRALHHQPNFAAAHNNLGEVFLARGEFEAAAASCRKAIELHKRRKSRSRRRQRPAGRVTPPKADVYGSRRAQGPRSPEVSCSSA